MGEKRKPSRISILYIDDAGSEGREYDWTGIIGLIKKYQPDTMIFNMGAPTVRWVSNEDGVAPYPCWNTAESAKVSMFSDDKLTWISDTSAWVPAECDVPICKDRWFELACREQQIAGHTRIDDGPSNIKQRT